MSTLAKPNLNIPLQESRQLTDFFQQGARPEADWGIGVEMEQLVIDSRSGKAADFARIEELLGELAKDEEWREVTENGRIIALVGPHSSVTLEPGGQLELSGRLCPDLCCNYGDFMRHVNVVGAAARNLDLRFLGLGTQPFSKLEEIEWVPKARYAVMGPYMLRTGDMGQRMMKQTAGLQVNLDYRDEQDCMAKLRLGQALAPLLYALFANSPLLEGRPSGFLNTRGEIWDRTDHDRTGVLPFLDEGEAGFAAYVDYALAVPMYFILREGRYIDLTRTRLPFRDFLENGFEGYRPILSDWDVHLSTLFPEVRLRPQIEVRSIDSLPPHLVMSAAAFLKGLFYDQTSRTEAWDLCRPESLEGLWDHCRVAWRSGLRATWRGGTLLDLGRNCLALAREGLAREAQRMAHGVDETAFLDNLEELLDDGRTLAERLLEQWRGDRRTKTQVLIEHCGFPGQNRTSVKADCADPQSAPAE